MQPQGSTMVEGFLGQASIAGSIETPCSMDSSYQELRSLAAVMQRAAAVLRNGSSSHMGAEADTTLHQQRTCARTVNKLLGG
jgi:hypothetical protein